VQLLFEQLVCVELAKRLTIRFWKWEYFWLSLIVVATVALHFMVITRPAEPLFDEQHYIPDARNIITEHNTARTEHPPLGKLAIVSGILIFGDNPWGWRLPSVAFGTAGIIFFYLTCRNLKMSRRASTLGTFIVASENLYFVHSGIAMLDIFMVSMMLLAFWLYARRSYPAAGVAVALAALAKFNGVFAILAIIIHWLFGRRDKPVQFVASLVLSGLAFALLYAAMDAAIYLKLVDFVTGFRNALSSTESLTFITAKHVSMSRPWEWVFNLEIMPYWYGTHYIGLVSFPVWALVVPTVIYTAFRSIKKDTAALFSIASFIAVYIVWIPLDIITNRITFIFYFLPAVPGVCLGLGIGMDYLINFWQTPRPPRQPRVKAASQALPPAAGSPAEGLPPLTTPAALALPPAAPPPLELAAPAPALGPTPAPKRRRKTKLQWAAISFVALFFAVQIATFVIVAPPLNTWHIENWFR
jgi:predicted membrane-bound dolichyl-phosphate-mannose-protein mannosyltransferase